MQKLQTDPYYIKQVKATLEALAHIVRSIAIKRVIDFNLDKNLYQNSWITISSNCYDLAIIEWCKIFSSKDGYICFKKATPNDEKKGFEARLCKYLEIDKGGYSSYVKELKTYRDKLIAHTDSDFDTYIKQHPCLDIALKSTFFYHKYFLSYYQKDHNSEKGISFFNHGTNDLEDYYNKYNIQVLKIIKQAIESIKDIDDICL